VACTDPPVEVPQELQNFDPSASDEPQLEQNVGIGISLFWLVVCETPETRQDSQSH
jgi:hypothetical protein